MDFGSKKGPRTGFSCFFALLAHLGAAGLELRRHLPLVPKHIALRHQPCRLAKFAVCASLTLQYEKLGDFPCRDRFEGQQHGDW